MLSGFISSPLLLLPFLFSSVDSAATQTACNNSPNLCSRTYDNVTQLGSHNSAFLRDATTGFSSSGNQFYNSTVQLDAGVRLLTAQVHNTGNSSSSTSISNLHLCHSDCGLLDAGTLDSWLSKIKTWLDNNKNDVVTLLLVNSDNVSGQLLGSAFSASGIQTYAYTPSNTSVPNSWPTLQEMISSNKRLVVFIASLADQSGPSYLLDEFTYVFENTFEWVNQTQYDCAPDRPSSVADNPSAAIKSGRMFLMNNFLYNTQLFGIEQPDQNRVNVTNAASGTGSLGQNLGTCAALYGQNPWGVLVDFFNVGPAIESIDKINGVSGSVTGRKTVSSAVVSSQTSTAAGRESSFFGLVVALAVVSGWMAL